MKYILILFLCWGFMACNSDQGKREEMIRELEGKVAKEPTDLYLKPLVANYIDYVNQYPNAEMTANYLYKAASLYYKIGSNKAAAENFDLFMRKFPEHKMVEDAMILLAQLYERMGRQQNATFMYKKYMAQYPEGKALKQAQYFFLPEKIKLRDKITTTQLDIDKLRRGDDSQRYLNYRKLINLVGIYLRTYSEDPLCAEYAFFAAMKARKIKEVYAAVNLYESILNNQPNYPKSAEVLFLLASIYGEDARLVFSNKNPIELRIKGTSSLKDFKATDHLKKAEALYDDFVKQYPEHTLIEEAKQDKEHLGKSPNEVVRSFKVK